jgi:large repetitive protein
MPDPIFLNRVTTPFGLVPVLGAPYNITFADIDGDGDLDAFIGSFSNGSTAFFQNNGSATSATFAAFVIVPGFLGGAPTFVDIDGDGDLDAFVGRADGTTAFYQNNGTANASAFVFINNTILGDVGTSSNPIFVDIDGDGDQDAFVGNQAGDTLFYRNTGNATSPSLILVSTNPFGLSNVGTNSNPTFVDVDRDGDLDAFIGNGAGNTFFYRNVGNITNPIFAPRSTNPFGLLGVSSASNPTFVDINGDGDLDAFNNDGVNTVFNANNVVYDNIFAAPISNPGLINVGFAVHPTFVDIDGDGDLDAFVGNNTGNTLFYRNIGSANSAVFTFISTNPFGLTNVGIVSTPTFVDIDGDGDLDAFIGNSLGNTLFYRNTGSATNPTFTFISTNHFGLTNVGTYSSPTFVDIDGDGDLDALIGSSSGNTLFYRNIGNTTNPTFTFISTNPFGLTNVGTFSKPTFVDIDRDGDLDALIGNGSGNTLFYQNTGNITNPTFTFITSNPFGLTNVGLFSFPTFVDIDGDGDLDTFVGNNGITGGNGNIQFFQNTINPIFAIRSTNPFGLSNVGTSARPTFVDIDNDGDLDAFIGNLAGNTLFYQNTGNANSAIFSSNPSGLSNGGGSSSPTFVDIDGDGDLDAFIGNSAGNTLFYFNNGSTSSASFVFFASNPFGLSNVGNFSNPTFVDIDDDGDLDAFIGNGAGNIFFYRNTGSATSAAFATPVTNAFGLVDIGGSSRPTFVDIDQDGDLDALVGNSAGDSWYYENVGNASTPIFATRSANPLGLNDIGSFASPTLVDIDRDGDLDAFVGRGDGNTLLFQNNSTRRAMRSDFGGDRTADILWRNTDGTVALWQMKGAALVAANIVNTVDNTWKIAGTGDFGGDQKVDIFWRNDNGQLALWQMNGAAIATPNLLSTITPDWKVGAVADFGGDGKADIFWRNDSGTLALWQMNGASIANAAFLTNTITPDWKIAGSGDFNGDKKADILWRNDNGLLAIWLMDGVNIASAGILSSITPDWQIKGVDDFNGDGKADILWRNNDGTIAEWQINGTAIAAGAVVGILTNDWKIAGTGNYNSDRKADILWRNDNGTDALWFMNGAAIASAAYTISADATWQVAAPII